MGTNINEIGNARNVNIGNKKSTNIKISIGAIVIIAVVIVVIFASNAGGMGKKIVGNWQMEGNGETYEFTSDGQMLRLTGSNDVSITYNIDGKRLYLKVNVLWATATVSADLSINGNTMTWTNFSDPDDIFGAGEGDTWTFTKVK